jgi:monoamine oxidase
MKTSADILIIGAGLTGVCAGRTLSAAGFDVLIVEASSRIGGRTYSKKIEHRIEEQGAEYLHPDHHRRAMKALADHHLKICPETPGTDETWLVSANHQRPASNLEPALIELSREIDREVKLIDPDRWITEKNAHLDQPFQDYVDQLSASSETREALLAWTATLTGADPRSFSALGILRDFFMFGDTLTALTAAEHRIEGGTQSLATAMVDQANLRIEFDQKVSEIEAAQQGYTAKTNTGAVFESRSLILSVPFNVLSAITLPPNVTHAAQDESQRGHANRSAKYWFDSDRVFDDRISAAPPALAFMEATGVAGCIIADSGLGTPNASHPIFEAVALPPKKPSDLRVHYWTEDPLVRGAWMTVRPGQASVIDQLWAIGAENPDFQIGSGDVTPNWSGWMEGALYAGETMAKRLILRPS